MPGRYFGVTIPSFTPIGKVVLAKLDALDVRILETLQGNGKLTNVELAKIVGLSPSPCLARVRALEERGLISHYVALLDPEKLGA